MFVTYVDIEDQRHDEGLRYSVYLVHRTEAAALRTAEVDERQQLLASMHHVQRQGIQWEWYHSSKGMLDSWAAEWLRLRLQAQEQRARHQIGRSERIRQEDGFRYHLARQWCVEQHSLHVIARGLVQQAGMEALEGEWRARIAQEEGQGWVARGRYFLLRADRMHREGDRDWPWGDWAYSMPSCWKSDT